MLGHLILFPILLPAIVAIVILLPGFDRLVFQRALALFVSVALIVLSAVLLLQVNEQDAYYYVVGNWRAPFGIELVADRVSVFMVLITSLLSLPVMLFACGGDDKLGGYFYPLALMELMGVNGAFLTGDLFNLFVFFEILLMASYAMVIHGGGKQKTISAIQYVILNLIGSGLFLLALGIIYAMLGTLNMADIAFKLNRLDPDSAIIVKVAAGLLMIVFGLKSAIFPLHFWLTKTYSAVAAPIAALFAILTKVGFYSMAKASIVLFGAHAGILSDVLQPWLWAIALATLSVGGIGLLASQSLRQCVAYLVIISAGTLLLSIALGTPQSISAGFYYAMHSTIAAAAFFLLADLIRRQRGQAGDRLVKARGLVQPAVLGIFYMLLALAVIGMPPLSGFVGKLLLLSSVSDATQQLWVWPALLLSGMLVLVKLARVGIVIFWDSGGQNNDEQPANKWQLSAIIYCLLLLPLFVVFAGAIVDYLMQAANDWLAVPRVVNWGASAL